MWLKAWVGVRVPLGLGLGGQLKSLDNSEGSGEPRKDFLQERGHGEICIFKRLVWVICVDDGLEARLEVGRLWRGCWEAQVTSDEV